MTQQEQLEAEMTELERMGSQPFASYLRPELVEYDLSVLDEPITPAQREHNDNEGR